MLVQCVCVCVYVYVYGGIYARDKINIFMRRRRSGRVDENGGLSEYNRRPIVSCIIYIDERNASVVFV